MPLGWTSLWGYGPWSSSLGTLEKFLSHPTLPLARCFLAQWTVYMEFLDPMRARVSLPNPVQSCRNAQLHGPLPPVEEVIDFVSQSLSPPNSVCRAPSFLSNKLSGKPSRMPSFGLFHFTALLSSGLHLNFLLSSQPWVQVVPECWFSP